MTRQNTEVTSGKEGFEAKQAIQSAQYSTPYHWSSQHRVENARYVAMTKELFRLMRDGISEGQPIRVLDIGCGDGRNSYLLWSFAQAEGLDFALLGVDISSEAIGWARQMSSGVPESQLSFLEGDHSEGLRWAAEQGGPVWIVLREVIEHLPEPEIDRVLQDCRTAVSDPRILISVPSANSPVERKHFRHYNAEMLRAVLERNGFECTHIGGFGFRPAPLYRRLRKVKGRLNRKPVMWRLMNPCWRPVRPSWAQTLTATGRSCRDSA